MPTKVPPPSPSNATPQAPGVAAPGSSDDYARADHTHASQILSVPVAGSNNPLVAGSGAPGSSLAYSREDHVHPAQAVPAASSTAPAALGTAAVGVSATFARSDHVHQTPTIPAASNANPAAIGAVAAGSSPDFSRADHVHPAPTIPAASSATPLANGTAAPGVSASFARGDHIHPATAAAIGAPNTRTLSFATAYQATDNTKAAIVNVNLTSTANLSLSGGTTNAVDVVIGSTNAVAAGTGTVVGKYANSNTGALTIGLALSTIAGVPVSFVLPPSWFFALRITSGAATVTSAFDQSLS